MDHPLHEPLSTLRAGHQIDVVAPSEARQVSRQTWKPSAAIWSQCCRCVQMSPLINPVERSLDLDNHGLPSMSSRNVPSYTSPAHIGCAYDWQIVIRDRPTLYGKAGISETTYSFPEHITRGGVCVVTSSPTVSCMLDDWTAQIAMTRGSGPHTPSQDHGFNTRTL